MNIQTSKPTPTMSRSEFRAEASKLGAPKEVVDLIPQGEEPVDSLVEGLEVEARIAQRRMPGRGTTLEMLALGGVALATGVTAAATGAPWYFPVLAGVGTLIGFGGGLKSGMDAGKVRAVEKQFINDANYLSELHDHMTDPSGELPEHQTVGQLGKWLLKEEERTPVIPVPRGSMTVAEFAKRMEEHTPRFADHNLSYFYPKDKDVPAEPWLQAWEQKAGIIEAGRGGPSTTPWLGGTPTVYSDPTVRAQRIRKLRRWHEHMLKHPDDEKAGWREGAPWVDISTQKGVYTYAEQIPAEPAGRRILVEPTPEK